MVRSSQPLCGLLVSLLLAGLTGAQEARKTFLIPPQDMGLDLPIGPLGRGGGSVLTYDDRQEPVVGKVYVRVGANMVVLLPDGQLVARKASDAPATERKFEEADKDKLAKALVEREFPNFRTRTTRNFLFIYNTSEEFAKGTSAILESMLPGMMQYAEAMKFDPRDPDVPLIVVMFRTDEEFQRYRRMPRGVVAYYHTLSNRVFLYEQYAVRTIPRPLEPGMFRVPHYRPGNGTGYEPKALMQLAHRHLEPNPNEGRYVGVRSISPLGDKAGIRRYGHFTLPMEETLATIAVEQHGELIVGDETHIDENLTDATQCHDECLDSFAA